MESIDDLKKLIKEEIIANFIASLDDCMSLNELEKLTKKMLLKLTSIALPEYIFQKQKNPQDNLEESKNQPEQQIDQNIFNKATMTVEEKSNSLRQEISLIEGEKENILKSMKRLEGYRDPKLLQQEIENLDRIIADKKRDLSRLEIVLRRFKQKVVENLNSFVKKVNENKFEFSFRLTAPNVPIQKNQNLKFPATLSYDNYIVACLDAKTWHLYNFMTADGKSSPTFIGRQTFVEKIQNALEVRRILLYFQKVDFVESEGKPALRGIQLFDKDGGKLFETAYDFSKATVIETILEEDERIVGFQARTINKDYAEYFDFQFVIGRLE